MPRRSRHLDGWSERVTQTDPAEVIILEPEDDFEVLANNLASRLEKHYITEKLLVKWGRPKLARYLANKIPSGKRGRSGDLGEILATEFVNSKRLPYTVPVNRLRWKDTRNLPMRGEDLIGFDFSARPIRFLKAEAKSRKHLSRSVIAEARKALLKNNGLPLPHKLGFIMERLMETNQNELAEAIEEYVIGRLPKSTDVAHMIFTLSENDPESVLTEDSANVGKGIKHYSVGARVRKHQEFIQLVFERALNGRIS